MAGIFEDQDIAAPQGGISPQQAVAPVSNTNVAASVGQGLTQLLGTGLSIYQNQQKAEAKQKQAAAVTGFAQGITALNEGVSQGKITQADAQRRQRVMFNQAIANNPSLTEDLIKLNSSLAGSAGLGDTLAEGTAVDQQIKADTKGATAAGFIQPNMSPQDQEHGLNLYRQQQQALNQMEFASKQLGLQNQQLSLQEKKANIANAQMQRANAAAQLQETRNRKAIQGGVADLSNVYTQDTLKKIGGLQEALANKQITPEQFLQQTQQLRNGFYSVTASARGAAGGDFIDSVSAPLFKILDAADAQASGKVGADVATAQLSQAQTHAALEIMSDPKLARIAAASKVFGNTFDPVIMANFSPDMLKVLNKNTGTGMPANAVSDDPDDQAAHTAYTDGLKSAITTLTSKNPAMTDPKGLTQELQTNLNQTLKSVGTMGASVDNPTQFNGIMKFLADPTFLAFQQHGGKIDPSLAQNAKNVIQENYQSQLIPAIRDTWEQAKTVTGVSTPAGGFPSMGGALPGGTTTQVDSKSAVTYRWTGQSLQFVPSPGYEKNRSVLAKAKELNQKVSPLVQRLVMADAHLEGNVDYSKYFKELEPAIFGQGGDLPDTSSQNDVPQSAQSAKAPKSKAAWSEQWGGNPSSVPGMVSQGDIDLTTRPQVKNADGSISTVRSMSFRDEDLGVEVLVPTVSEDGRIMSDQEAVDQYFRTGKHLGMFRTPEAADKYAEELHNRQAKFYGIK